MKRRYLVIILTVFIFLGVNSTFASEHGNETLMLHESALELSVEETPDVIQNEEDNTGTFKDLKSEINSASVGGEIKLEKNYTYNPTTDDVLVVSESYTVEKKALNTTVKVGEQVTFSIIVTNTGGTII